MDSILNSIKKLLGITEEQTDFDTDIIIHINTVFGEGASETWDDYITDKRQFEKVKTYMYLKVRLYFDLPQNSSLSKAMEQQISELEWRLNVTAENQTE